MDAYAEPAEPEPQREIKVLSVHEYVRQVAGDYAARLRRAVHDSKG